MDRRQVGSVSGNVVYAVSGRQLYTASGASAVQTGVAGLVEEYTLAVDVKLPAIGEYFSIFQTDLSNSDDADIFINRSGKVEIGSLPYSDGVLSAGIWYRLVFSVKKNGWFQIYLDGELFHTATGDYFNNDRFYFSPSGVILFGDDDGEDNEFDVAEVAIYKGAKGEM